MSDFTPIAWMVARWLNSRWPVRYTVPALLILGLLAAVLGPSIVALFAGGE